MNTPTLFRQFLLGSALLGFLVLTSCGSSNPPQDPGKPGASEERIEDPVDGPEVFLDSLEKAAVDSQPEADIFQPPPSEVPVPDMDNVINDPIAPDQPEKTKEKVETITLLPFRLNYEMKVGQVAEYTAAVHGSTGEWVEVSTNTPKILELQDTDFSYADESNAELDGGDAGYKTYSYKALQPGIGKIQVTNSFQGEIEDEFEMIITVK